MWDGFVFQLDNWDCWEHDWQSPDLLPPPLQPFTDCWYKRMSRQLLHTTILVRLLALHKCWWHMEIGRVWIWWHFVTSWPQTKVSPVYCETLVRFGFLCIFMMIISWRILINWSCFQFLACECVVLTPWLMFYDDGTMKRSGNVEPGEQSWSEWQASCSCCSLLHFINEPAHLLILSNKTMNWVWGSWNHH